MTLPCGCPGLSARMTAKARFQEIAATALRRSGRTPVWRKLARPPGRFQETLKLLRSLDAHSPCRLCAPACLGSHQLPWAHPPMLSLSGSKQGVRVCAT